MELLQKSDNEILKIAAPLWDNLINCGETPGSITFINDSACVMLGIHRRHAIVVYRRSREFIAK